MNPTLIAAFWMQRLTSPIRVVLLGLAFGIPLLAIGAMNAGLTALGDSAGLTMIFAVGMIGQDLSSGVLQLLFARPVRRAEYVFSRWIAVGAAAGAVGLVQTAIAGALMAAHGSAPPATEFALFAVQRVLECFGVAAVFTLLSTLIAGVGDLAFYFVGSITSAVGGLVAQSQHWTIVVRAADELDKFLSPKLPLAQMINASPFQFTPLVSYLSTVSLCLVLAIVVMNRKELSYASG
ncbi:MAG: ABC transporter permease subunit [Candidatus Eisenbacteria bacterium]|uniref:ABC transporter permease subunit n=1 Tax=Eiseniibacteriota bacterium TaxID=2212470 RepID=A0A9D6L7P6_UNCEI|nr:ABC transporter permease subunit [Candidatus Eisenbacteria bacterium]MBI3540266.1 ABC transporter permease subunit [Candidatus Eisenbacteria bacterium]